MKTNKNKRFGRIGAWLVAIAVAASFTAALADEEPAGETLGAFCWSSNTGAVVNVEVAADAIRVLDAMPYGRGTGTKIVKTGAGKLVIKDLRNYPGTVYLNEGSIRIGDVDEDEGEEEVCDIQNLAIADGTTVEVAAGKTARVALTDFSASFTKAGEGLLQVVNAANKKLTNVSVTGGRIVYVNEPTVSALAEMAAGPSMHLDANDADSIEFSSSKYVSKWYDAKGVNYAETGAGWPTLVKGATTNFLTKTPLNAVSFGGFRSQCRASFHEATHGVRVAFVVAAKGDSNQIGMLFGTSPSYCIDASSVGSKDIVDFYYGNDSSGWPSYPFRSNDNKTYTVRFNCGTVNYYWDDATNGVRRTSGSTTTSHNVPSSNSTTDFMLYEVVLPVGAHISALAGAGSNYLVSGGWRYGEILLYERPLTDRERIATRNYLAKKWLSRTDDELTALPDAPADPDPFVLPEYKVKGGDSLTVEAGDTIHANLMTGTGAFTKDGEGALSVKDFVGYTGTVTVAAGTLNLTGAQPTYEPVDPAALEPTVHFDANEESSLTYIDESAGTISAWASKNGAGVSAKKKLNSLGSSGTLNVKTSDELGGKKYVNFPSYTGAHFRDDATGGTNTFTVKTMVTFIGSQNGGGMLMGGRDSGSYCDPFFRGPGYGGSAGDPLLWSGTESTYPTRYGEFYLNFERLANSASDYGKNGARDPAVVGLSGGWDVVGFRASGADTTDRQTVACGLAYESVPGHYRDGKQNLAEIAVWTNRILSVAEVQSVEAYLRIKYNLEPTWERSRYNGLALNVAEGATVDLGGTSQYAKSLSGAGSVVNGTLNLAELTLDAGAEAKSFAFTLGLEDMERITIANATQIALGETKTLLTATAISGTLDGIEIAGLDDVPETVGVTLTIDGNALKLTLAQKAKVDVLTPEEGGTVFVPAAFTTAVEFVAGEGAFTKTGAGTLAAKDVVGHTGTVTVAEGTLAFAGVRPPYEPKMPDAKNLVMHLDSSDASTFTTADHSDGNKRVLEWRSKTDNGWKVTPVATSFANYPRYSNNLGLPNGEYGVQIPTHGMYFRDADGNRVMTTNVLSALWMFGSQDGGGFLLGTAQSYNGKKSHFFRGANGGDYGSKAADYLLYVGACDGARTGEYYLDDVLLRGSASWGSTPPSTYTPQQYGLSGEWQFISCRILEGAYSYKVAADSLAHNPDTSSRSGHQRLAELCIYERLLTRAEERSASAYLRIKWGVEPTWMLSQYNDFGVSVAEGATVDLGGTTQYVKGIDGAGTVTNGTLLTTEIALDAADTLVMTDATLDLSQTKRITIANATQALGTPKTLLAATAISGTLDGVEIVGLDVPQTADATLEIVDNALVLTVVQKEHLRTLSPADGESVLVPADDTTAADYIVGEGSFTKTGAGTLAAKDIVGYTGTVTVAAGTLKLTGALPPVEPALPGDSKLVLHLDAADTSTLTTKTVNNVEYVEEWRSKTANGWRAKPRVPSEYNTSHAWLEADSDLGGQKTIRFRRQSGAGMYFYDADGNRAQTTNVLSAIWMLGSQEGGGFLLGQGIPFGNKGESTTKTDGWHRGSNGYGSSYTDCVFFSGAYNGVRTAEMYFNDKRMCGSAWFPKGKTTPDLQNGSGFTGGWDAITLRINESSYAYTVAADGLAFHSNDSYGRNGAQRLVETLIYERMLTEEEAYKANVYLRAKWGTENWQRSQKNAFAVSVASEATLDLGGTNQYVKAIGGAGAAVNGNVTAEGIIASADGALALAGSFTATDGFTVDVRGLPDGLTEDITVLTAAEGIVNPENIKNATIITEGGRYETVRARVNGNSVVLRIRKRGMTVIFY